MGGGGTGLGLGVGMGVGLGALGSPAFAILFPIGVMGGAWALARGIFRNSVHGRMRILTKLMNEMVATVEDGLEGELLAAESSGLPDPAGHPPLRWHRSDPFPQQVHFQ